MTKQGRRQGQNRALVTMGTATQNGNPWQNQKAFRAQKAFLDALSNICSNNILGNKNIIKHNQGYKKRCKQLELLTVCHALSKFSKGPKDAGSRVLLDLKTSFKIQQSLPSYKQTGWDGCVKYALTGSKSWKSSPNNITTPVGIICSNQTKIKLY